MQSGLYMDSILIGFLIVSEQYAQNSEGVRWRSG